MKKKILLTSLFIGAVVLGSGGYQFSSGSGSSSDLPAAPGTVSATAYGFVGDENSGLSCQTADRPIMSSSGLAAQTWYSDQSSKFTPAAPTGAGGGIKLDLSSWTSKGIGLQITDSADVTGFSKPIQINSTLNTGASLYYGMYQSVTGAITGAATGVRLEIDNSNPNGSLNYHSGSVGGNNGVYAAARAQSATGAAVGVFGDGYQSKTNVGGLFMGVESQDVSGAASYGVRALASGGNGAVNTIQRIGVYGYITPSNVTTDTNYESRNPAVSAAAVFDNTTAANDILVLKDNNVSKVSVTDGGDVLMSAGMAITPWSLEISSDNQTVTPTNLGHLRLSSDNSTATSRTFTLADGTYDGQRLLLEWIEDSGTGAGELTEAAGNVNLSASWSPSIGDTIQLVWNATASEWREIGRTDN